MKTNRELQQELIDLFNQVKSGHVRIPQADTMTNAAGKLISSVKLELEYAKLRKEKPSIPFLDAPAK